MGQPLAHFSEHPSHTRHRPSEAHLSEVELRLRVAQVTSSLEPAGSFLRRQALWHVAVFTHVATFQAFKPLGWRPAKNKRCWSWFTGSHFAMRFEGNHIENQPCRTVEAETHPPLEIPTPVSFAIVTWELNQHLQCKVMVEPPQQFSGGRRRHVDQWVRLLPPNKKDTS